MTSDNIAALQEIERNGRAFLHSIESLYLAKEINQELLDIAVRQAFAAMLLAEIAIKYE